MFEKSVEKFKLCVKNWAKFFLQQIVKLADTRSVWKSQFTSRARSCETSIIAFHLEHEHNKHQGPGRDHSGDLSRSEAEQLRLRAARAFPAALYPRRSELGHAHPVGNGGL